MNLTKCEVTLASRASLFLGVTRQWGGKVTGRMISHVQGEGDEETEREPTDGRGKLAECTANSALIASSALKSVPARKTDFPRPRAKGN